MYGPPSEDHENKSPFFGGNNNGEFSTNEDNRPHRLRNDRSDYKQKGPLGGYADPSKNGDGGVELDRNPDLFEDARSYFQLNNLILL